MSSSLPSQQQLSEVSSLMVPYKQESFKINKDPRLVLKYITKDQSDNFLLAKLTEAFGEIDSLKIIPNAKPNKLSYAYLSFKKMDSANKCLQEFSKLNLGIECEQYENRDLAFHNIILQNLLSIPCDLLKQNLLNNLSKYGNIQSIILRKNLIQKVEKYCSLVCFKNSQDAQNAIDELNGKDINGVGNSLYVNWALSKAIKEKLKIDQDHTIFLKNLKQSITEKMLLDAFSQFGPVLQCTIKVPLDRPYYLKEVTKFGYICFYQKLDALKAQERIYSVKNLFEGEQFYVNRLVKKNELPAFKEYQYQLQLKQQQQQQSQQQYQQQQPQQTNISQSQLNFMFQQLFQFMQLYLQNDYYCSQQPLSKYVRKAYSSYNGSIRKKMEPYFVRCY